MDRLLPAPATPLDPFEAYGRVEEDGRPLGRWLRIGMVLSVDGSATDEQGWTDDLGGPADFAVFRTLRALADAVLVGAGTVRTGRLGPARLRADLRSRRAALGKDGPAPIVVVTRDADLDWSLPLFTAAQTPTMVVTARRAAATVPACLPVIAVRETADGLDLTEAVLRLRDEHGLPHLLCEGGPALATALLRAGLVDELCLSLAPTLIGGPHHTRLLGELSGRVELRLDAVYTADDVLFLRYLTGGAGRPCPRSRV